MARLVFNMKEVERIFHHTLAQGSKGEFSMPYGLQDEEAKPGFFLVHDQGVYLMSNAKKRLLVDPDNEKSSSVVAYAEGCNPDKDDDWYEAAVSLVGGDDFAEFIPLAWFSLARKKKVKKFVIKLTTKKISLAA